MTEQWLLPLSYSEPLLQKLVNTGWQRIVVDLEHGVVTPETLGDCLRTVVSLGATPIVRPASNTGQDLLVAARAGAQLLLVSDVRCANELAASLQQLSHAGHLEVRVFALIESLEGIAQAEKVAAVQGVDGVLFGPYDLGIDLGVENWRDWSSLAPTLLPVLACMQAQGVPSGLYALPAWLELPEFPAVNIRIFGLHELGALHRVGLA